MNGLPGVVLLLVVALTAGLFAGWVLAMATGLARLGRLVQEAWRQLDDELRRRHELVPDLVAAVQAHVRAEEVTAATERLVRAVSVARNLAAGNGASSGRGAAEAAVSVALGRLYAEVEAYPAARDDVTFVALRGELTDAEDRIRAGRRLYNPGVLALDARLGTYPSRLVARWAGVGPAVLFDAAPGGDPRDISVPPAPPAAAG